MAEEIKARILIVPDWSRYNAEVAARGNVLVGGGAGMAAGGAAAAGGTVAEAAPMAYGGMAAANLVPVGVPRASGTARAMGNMRPPGASSAVGVISAGSAAWNWEIRGADAASRAWSRAMGQTPLGTMTGDAFGLAAGARGGMMTGDAFLYGTMTGDAMSAAAQFPGMPAGGGLGIIAGAGAGAAGAVEGNTFGMTLAALGIRGKTLTSAARMAGFGMAGRMLQRAGMLAAESPGLLLTAGAFITAHAFNAFSAAQVAGAQSALDATLTRQFGDLAPWGSDLTRSRELLSAAAGRFGGMGTPSFIAQSREAGREASFVNEPGNIAGAAVSAELGAQTVGIWGGIKRTLARGWYNIASGGIATHYPADRQGHVQWDKGEPGPNAMTPSEAGALTPPDWAVEQEARGVPRYPDASNIAMNRYVQYHPKSAYAGMVAASGVVGPGVAPAHDAHTATQERIAADVQEILKTVKGGPVAH